SATPRDEPNGDTPTWTPDDIAVTRLLPIILSGPSVGDDASAAASATRPGRTLGQEPGQCFGQCADQSGVLFVADPRTRKDAQDGAHRCPLGLVSMLAVQLMLGAPGDQRGSA